MVVHGKTKRLKANEGHSTQPKAPKILNGNELHAFLRPQNQSVSVEGLKVLRNQLTLKPDEGNVNSNDERLVLLKDWLEISPGAQDIFALMENQAQPGTVSICLSILTCILNLTSIHFGHQPLGQSIVKRLLTPQWMRKFESQLNGIHHDNSLAAMKLLNAISAFAGRKEQKTLLESFSWDAKLFHKLLYMRRRGKETSDMLLNPDIRTLTIQFILSFVSPLSPSYVKSTLLEQHRDVLLSIFKILHMDPYPVVRFVLETLWTNIWLDQKVKRTLKIGIFGEATIQHLLKIYDCSEAEGAVSANIPADLVHHFLLAICTHRGTGICFADSGWYPRQDEETAQPDDEVNRSSHKTGGKIYNKILANVLKMLKVNDDPRQQELALKILAACPELVSGYLTSVGLTLEPRLSSKWLANIAFLGSVVSLPVPVGSFLLPLGTATSSSVAQYQPTPPPLWVIVENVMPSLNLKVHFTKAIQSTSALVQHSAAIALAKCLQKCENLLEVFNRVEQALGEDGVTGQWTRRRQEVEKEMRRRVPDFQVIIAFSNAHNSPSDSEERSDARVRSVLMAEIAQRLMWLYHRCCPSLVAEARYDIAKTLATLDVNEKSTINSEGIENLLGLRRLHILNMLRESDQFVWHAKIGTHSNIYVLLHIYVNTPHGAIRDSVISLLTRTLRDSQLFQHDPEELTLWLDALPKGIRGPDAETPDGAKLTDERQSVLTFLDDCLQRCGRTPYRYLEELSTLSESMGAFNIGKGDHWTSQGRVVNASPLLATYLEQLSAKLRSQFLTPSDALALATYIRKVTVGLLGKQWDTRLCDGVATRLSQILCDQDVFGTFPVISRALKKEVALLRDYVDCCRFSVRVPEDLIDVDVSASIDEFLIQVEQIAKSEGRAEVQAYELVDWLRIVDKPLDLDSTRRLMKVVLRFHPPALLDFFDYISPKSTQLWDCILELSDLQAFPSLSFSVLFLHTFCRHLQLPKTSELLRRAIESRRGDLYIFKNYCGLLLYHVNRPMDVFDGNIMQIMTLVIACAKDILSPSDLATLKQYLLTERSEMKTLLCQTYSSAFLKVLDPFLEQVVDCNSGEDRALVDPICKQWISLSVSLLSSGEIQVPCGVGIWLKYMASKDVLDICDLTIQVILDGVNKNKKLDIELRNLAEQLLEVVLSLDDQSLTRWLNLKMPAMVTLRQRLQPPLKVLNWVISRSLISTMPLAFDGHLPDWRSSSLFGYVSLAERHWKQRLHSIPQNVSLHSILQNDNWSSGDSDIVKALTYRSSAARATLWDWLSQKDFSDTKTLHACIPVVNTLADSYCEGGFPDDNSAVGCLVQFTEYLARSIFEEHGGSQNTQYIECLTRLVKYCVPQRPLLIEALTKRSIKQRMDLVHPAFFDLVSAIKKVCSKEGVVLVTAITNHTLQWAARCLSEDGELSESESKALKALGEFVTEDEHLAPQFTEPVLVAIIRNHLIQPNIMYLARTIFVSTKLKPANVNRLLQSTLQHSQFTRIVESKAKDAVLWFMYSLFHSHPSNTCQPSHIVPLLQLYSGSLSAADQLILAILQLFESERKSSVASLLATWSATGSSAHQSFLDVICILEPGRVLRTILNFPYKRSLTTDGRISAIITKEEDHVMYDPVFMLLLLAHSFSDSPPQTALSWVQFYRSNVISLTIRCLSATDSRLRLLANLQLTALWNLMQSADMQERDQVLYVLNLLRDQLPSNLEDPPNRLPSYITLFLAHSLRGIFYPSNFIYPITARFLLQRPELDLNDVPLLFGLLYSSSDDWKKERAWIIRFLADGMQGSEDWRLLKRRHTWDLLASLYESSPHDKSLRHGILEFLANLTCHPSATTSLLLKSSLIQWIEIQLINLKRDEAIAWAKILENMLVVVDSEKIEKATRGEWKAGLLRCIKYLHYDSEDINLLRLLSRVMSRMAMGPLSDQELFMSTLAVMVDRLAHIEQKLDCSVYDWRDSMGLDLLPPHRSQNLHQLCFENDLKSWGCMVEDLWGAAMSCNTYSGAWDRLTSRLLVWRAITGERIGSVGEWARRQSNSMLTL